MLKPTSLLALLPLGAALALAQPAMATDYCVDVAMTCDAANDLPNFETALGKADDSANADRIFLGAGPYAAPGTAGFNYQSGPVEVIGKGQGTTILTSSGWASERVLRLMAARARQFTISPFTRRPARRRAMRLSPPTGWRDGSR